MEPIPHAESPDFEIHRQPIGNTFRPAAIEMAGFLVFWLSLAAFVVWLVVFGVNV